MLNVSAFRGPNTQSNETSPSGSALTSGGGAVVGKASRNLRACRYASKLTGLAPYPSHPAWAASTRISFSSNNAESVVRLTARLASRCLRISSRNSLSSLADELCPVERDRLMRPGPLGTADVTVIRTSPPFFLLLRQKKSHS